jgi:hypothetical protein
MINARFALVVVRLILTGVAAVYGVLKLTVAPDAAPLLGVPASLARELTLPYETNPTFARLVIVVSIIVALTIIAVTVRDWVKETKEYGHPAPFASPLVLALMTMFALFAVYYFVVAVVVGAFWFYSLTVASISVLLALYEGRQYSDGH